jgi:hypothetical protein
VEEPAIAGRTVVNLTNGARMTALIPEEHPRGGTLWLAIRPENLKLVDPTEAAHGSALDRLSGRPTTRVFAGDRIEVTVELEGPGGESIVFHAPPDAALSDTVRLRAEPHSAVLVGADA